MSDRKQMDKGCAAAIRAGMGPWFRRASTHGPLIVGLLVLSSGAPTVAADKVISELKVGIRSHDVSVLGSNEEKGIDVNAEILFASRSEERRVGKECVCTCRSRWSPYQ